MGYAYGKPQATANIRLIQSVSDLSDAELLAVIGEVEGQLIEAEADEPESTD
jgi:hypothetical protein